MDALIYFDTEDFFSPPEAPVHRLPGQLAEIMTRHGLPGCFHIHGEKARFMERHGQTEVIEALRQHDVSLHYDRGSVHPTTAEEVSQLDWYRGVERTLFRGLPGFQALERIFGQSSSLTQHGGTFAAPVVYAAAWVQASPSMSRRRRRIAGSSEAGLMVQRTPVPKLASSRPEAPMMSWSLRRPAALHGKVCS